MKRILIVGKTSYIGNEVKNWLLREKNDYHVESISVRGNEWKNLDFSIYDSIFHVAGIAHVDTGKLSEEEKNIYYEVNTDLTLQVAEKYKEDAQKNDNKRVKQFIYMSSIIIFDDKAELNKKRVITKKTIPNPLSFYGDSKLQAENRLKELNEETFRIAIVRPPMIYGKNSKGNYQVLKKLAVNLPIFPNISNERSMLYIDNLCEFIKLLIDSTRDGIYHPQNSEYVQTSKLVQEIAECNKQRIRLFTWGNFFIKLLARIPGKIGNLTNKAFGNLVYEKELSQYDFSYQIYDLKESVKLTEDNNL